VDWIKFDPKTKTFEVVEVSWGREIYMLPRPATVDCRVAEETYVCPRVFTVEIRFDRVLFEKLVTVDTVCGKEI